VLNSLGFTTYQLSSCICWSHGVVRVGCNTPKIIGNDLTKLIRRIIDYMIIIMLW